MRGRPASGRCVCRYSEGYEIAPVREKFTVGPDTDVVTFEIDRVLEWREKGWVTADTHVHFLSPQTALLEGEGEGVNVVNLLASQWGEMFSNVSDFDGKTTLGAQRILVEMESFSCALEPRIACRCSGIFHCWAIRGL